MSIIGKGDCGGGGNGCKPGAGPAASLQGIGSDQWTYCGGVTVLPDPDCGNYNGSQGDYTIIAISCVTDAGPD